MLCRSCAGIYIDCLSHMDIHEVIEQKEDPTSHVAQAYASAKAIQQGGPKNFKEESAVLEDRMFAEVSRTYLCMNEKEFTKEVGVQPLQKHVRYWPCMSVRAEGPEAAMEKVWLFAWEPGMEHLRTVRLGYNMGVVVATELVAPTKHLYKEQCSEVQQWKMNSTMVDNHFELDFSSMANIRSIATARSKLDPNATSGQPKVGKDGKPSTRAQQHLEAADVAKGSADNAEKGDSTTASSAGPSPSKRTQLVGLFNGSVAKGPPAASPSHSGSREFDGGPANSQRARSPVLGGQPSVLDDGASDVGTATIAGTAVSAKSQRGMLANASQEVTKWVQKLDLEGCMLNHRETQFHHAQQAEAKLRKNGKEEAKKLKNHLKVVSLARALRPSAMNSLEPDELKLAITEVMSRVQALPGPVMLGLLRRLGAEIGEKVMDEASFDKFVRIVWPWPWAGAAEEDSEPTFDPHEPKVHCLPDTAFEQKEELFMELGCRPVLCKLIEQGESKKQLVAAIFDKLKVETERLLEEEEDDAQDGASSLMCELLTASHVLELLVKPADLLISHDTEERLNELGAFQNALKEESGSFLPTIAVACSESEFYSKTMQWLLQIKGPLMDVAPIAKESLSKLSGLDNLDFGQKCAEVKEVLRSHPRLTISLDSRLVESFSQKVLAVVSSLVRELEASLQNTPPDKDNLEALTNMLAEASNSYPFDDAINKWQGVYANPADRGSPAQAG